MIVRFIGEYYNQSYVSVHIQTYNTYGTFLPKTSLNCDWNIFYTDVIVDYKNIIISRNSSRLSRGTWRAVISFIKFNLKIINKYIDSENAPDLGNRRCTSETLDESYQAHKGYVTLYFSKT